MLFRAAASVTILACAVNASAEPKPYRLATMPVLGMSLARRDTNGYIPEQTVCGEGNTCSEACGAGYTECASTNDSIHCYNPDAQQKCCTDGSGNSCDAGYYCSHDTQNQTWCCPDSMDLAECAAAYNVVGGLETPAPATTSAASSTVAPTTTSAPATTETPEFTTSSILTTSAANTTVVETVEKTTTYCPPTSSGFSSAWPGLNSTVSTAAPSTTFGGTVPTGPAPVETPIFSVPPSGAAHTGVSALLLLAVGVVAFL
ncbi:hypothetical protein B0I35DRAFT_13237 [Stachybotrys elegans]|uniref:Prp 4 CRoW domain-containing protein n=1 Tax=Stachybotrys elegans TaxID=80388 RepID=A0A8K0WW35_9HYPO|nr:hypothetical protein B0I35DRAFT_13237 [Stachybotrys elegans]